MGAASQELIERAKLLISERRYQEAVRACRRALLVHPEQVEIRLLLGEALLALERYDEVRVEMMALVRKSPKHGAVHRLLGEAYLRDGRPTQAVESLRKALQLDPNDEVAEELLTEAADESAPVSTTIERWFADEAAPTQETESPAWEEETTPLPGPGPATSPGPAPAEPSIQIDPQLVGPPKTSVSRPRVRSRKATMLGQAAKPPTAGPPTRDRPVPAASHDARPGPAAPPPGHASPFGAPSSSPFPASRPPARPLPAPSPPRHLGPRDHEPPTSARSVARVDDDDDPETDELVLENIPSDELSMEELDQEPTNFRVSADPEPPTKAQVPSAKVLASHGHRSENEFDEVPTQAFSAATSEAVAAHLAASLNELPGEPTKAHVPRRAPSIEPPAFSRLGTPELPPYPAYPRADATPFPPEPASAPLPAEPVYADPSRAPAAPTPLSTSPAAKRRIEKNIETTRLKKSKKSWVLPVVIGGSLLVLLGIAGGFAVSAWRAASAAEELRASAAAAGDSGSRAALEALAASLADADEPDRQALRARLLATLLLEHDRGEAPEVEALIQAIPGDRPTDAVIASALLAVDRGDPAAAVQTLSGLTAEGEQIPEAFRARALATAALGRWAEAEQAAGQAASARPGATRHLVLHAFMRYRAGDSAAALTLLDSVPEGATDPAVRVTRARILQDSGSDPARAVEEANAVLTQLESRASPQQLATAHLIRARHAAAQGDAATALAEARLAVDHVPPGDEAFGMGLVETFLRAGDAPQAAAQLARLPEPAVDAPARALLVAEVALAQNDLDRAEAALANASEGPRRDLMRAQILEARGRPEEARPLYEAAMNAPGPEGRRVRARVRLAAIELATGHGARTIELLEPVRERAGDDPELVPLLARAYLAGGRLDDAQQLLEVGLRQRPDDGDLLGMHGMLLLRRGQIPEALASLQRAAQLRPNDADVHASLGDAAGLAGQAAAAVAAYARALELEPTQSRALLGQARLALRARDLDTTQARLDAITQPGPLALDIGRVRAELLVARGEGELGIATVEALARENESDPQLWTALGALQAQAERDRDADRSFERALRIDPNRPQALLGQSLIQIRTGSLAAARRSIATAEREAERRELTDQLGPWIEVANGRYAFEMGSFEEVVRRANAAIAVDPNFATAHLLIANVAIERNDDPLVELRRAVGGFAPAPEALGRLAPRLGRGEEACRIAQRYMQIAPTGYDATEVRRIADRCP